MASFRIAAIRAKDAGRPLPQRYRALRWAVESYSWLTRQSFRAIYAHLVVAVAVVDEQRFTSAEISAATDLLIASRLRFLKQLEQFAATQRYQKGQGQRRPLPTAVNVLYSLNSALPLTVPPSPAPGDAPQSGITPAQPRHAADSLHSPLMPDVRPHSGRQSAFIITSRSSTESPVSLLARLSTALVGSFLGVVATLVAGVAYFVLLGTADDRLLSAAYAAAVFVLPSAYVPALPGAILGLAWQVLSPRHGSIGSSAALSSVAALAGGGVGFWFTYRTPAIPTLSAVVFSALSWAVTACISVAIALVHARHNIRSGHSAA